MHTTIPRCGIIRLTSAVFVNHTRADGNPIISSRKLHPQKSMRYYWSSSWSPIQKNLTVKSKNGSWRPCMYLRISITVCHGNQMQKLPLRWCSLMSYAIRAEMLCLRSELRFSRALERVFEKNGFLDFWISLSRSGIANHDWNEKSCFAINSCLTVAIFSLL